MEKPSHNVSPDRSQSAPGLPVVGLRTSAAMLLLFALITVPFAIASVLLIQHRLGMLDTYDTMREDVRLFDEGLAAFPPLNDMRDLAPAAIHTQEPEIVSRFELSRSRAGSRLLAFLQLVRQRDISGLNDQGGLLNEAWRDLTVKTGIPLEDVVGPFDNVNQITQRLSNALSTVLFVSDLSIGEGLEPNEVLSLPLGSFRQAQEDIGLIRALALYVSLRGGYLGDNDARRLENAWQRLQHQMSIIDSEIKALVARTGAIELQQQWRLVQGGLLSFLEWSERELILAPRIQVSWEGAYDRSRNAMKSLDGLSATLISLADQLLNNARQEKARATVWMMLGIVLLYVLVLGLALWVYRANSRAINARAESQAKGLFLARMSHEIRTPLNGVIGLAELLRETDPSPRQQEYISLIDSAGRTLTALINDVLDFAKIEAGKLELVEERFDLPTLLAECVQMFNLPASDNGTLVILDVDPHTPSDVVGDAIRLRQILINLIGNAVKFTRNGRVVLSLVCRRHGGEAPLFTFAVTDTGIGLTQDEQTQLFQRFTQASANTARRYGGTGLGLSISRELVGLMGGEIHVHSAPGLGSRFSFSIQMASEQDEIPMMAELPPASWLWDVQGSLEDWLVDDPRFETVKVVENTGQLAEANGEIRSGVLLINGLPEQALLDEALQMVRLNPARIQVLVLIGMRCDTPDWLPREVRVLRRSVVTVNDLQQLLGSYVPGAIPIVTEPVAVESISSLRVLIVEDNPVNQMVTKGYLERLGIAHIIVAEDGQQGVDCFDAEDGELDLVLMDLDMPVMDGFTSAHHIRELEAQHGWAPCQVLALSAHAISEQGGRVSRAGMNGQLIKPLSLAAMKQALSQYLGVTA